MNQAHIPDMAGLPVKTAIHRLVESVQGCQYTESCVYVISNHPFPEMEKPYE